MDWQRQHRRDETERAGSAGRLDSATLGYTTLRLGIGMSMLIHGVNRIGNIATFGRTTAEMFSKTWIPATAVIAFAYLTPPVELLIGTLVLLGLFTRLGLAAGGLWMVALIFGSTSLGSYDVVGIQLIYSLIFSELLRLEPLNQLSVDRFLRGRRMILASRRRAGGAPPSTPSGV